MSSLQQRATSSSSTPSSHSNDISKSNNQGTFESCFAQGLDLSEFESTSNNNMHTAAAAASRAASTAAISCASATLLPIIQRRAQERHSNDQEELRLQSKIQARAVYIQNELKATAVDDKDLFLGSRELTNALVSMHDNDHYGGGGGSKKVGSQTHKHRKHTLNVVIKKNKKKQQYSGTSVKLPQLSHHAATNKKKTIAKKAVRAKYH
jgi:hypothetical protein